MNAENSENAATSESPAAAVSTATEEGSLANDARFIRISVVGQDSTEVMVFRVKRSVALKKLMHKYCQRLGIATTSVRFLFNGRRIRPEDSPVKLEMEDGDLIDVFREQTGGGRHVWNHSGATGHPSINPSIGHFCQ